jgi:TatA/E family protein of Tat protein translocase
VLLPVSFVHPRSVLPIVSALEALDELPPERVSYAAAAMALWLPAVHGGGLSAVLLEGEQRREAMPHLGMPELLIILALVLVLFGAKKVPEMARGLGQGLKELKKAVREASSDEETGAD